MSADELSSHLIQVAFQQADYVAWNLWAAINNRPLLPFRCVLSCSEHERKRSDHVLRAHSGLAEFTLFVAPYCGLTVIASPRPGSGPLGLDFRPPDPDVCMCKHLGSSMSLGTLNDISPECRYQHLGDMMSLGAVNGAVTLPLPLPPPLAGALRGGILGSLAGAAGVKVDSADDSRRITLDGAPSGCCHSWRWLATLAGCTAIVESHSTASNPAPSRCRLQLLDFMRGESSTGAVQET